MAWHAFLDGRDTPPKSAAGYLRQVAAKLGEIGVGELVSAVGRYYAMDRDKRWDRLEIAWKMLTRGEGTLVDDLAAAVEKNYTAGPDGQGKEMTDEFELPLVRKGADGKARAVIKDGDACFFYNFRSDRARQLTLALHAGADAFPYFDRGRVPKLATPSFAVSPTPCTRTAKIPAIGDLCRSSRRLAVSTSTLRAGSAPPSFRPTS